MEGEEEVEEGDPRLLDEWERLEVEAEEVEIQNYTMVETLTARHVSEVKSCLARMVARLKYLGLDVRRVHSDAAGEMRGTKKWCEDRGLYRTFTCGSDWKANGRAEAEIGVIRRAVNTLIRSADEGEDFWPLMAKHVGERRGRQQLAALGFSTPRLLPWGQRVMITTKGWDEFQGHWRPEITNFDSNQAIQRVSEKEALDLVHDAEEKGQRAEIIPGMGVFTRKAGDGRRRARIVCCGNYMEARSGDEVYAGADSTQLRAMLRVASLHDWHCLSLDVKSAFLLSLSSRLESWWMPTWPRQMNIGSSLQLCMGW